jgi:hypothetical protein
LGKTLILLAAALALSGCAINRSLIPVGVPCNVFSADGKHGFEPDKGASGRWSRSEKEQLVTLNETGERFCQWKPPAS